MEKNVYLGDKTICRLIWTIKKIKRIGYSYETVLSPFKKKKKKNLLVTNFFVARTFGDGAYATKVISSPNVIADVMRTFGDENFCYQKIHFVTFELLTGGLCLRKPSRVVLE